MFIFCSFLLLLLSSIEIVIKLTVRELHVYDKSCQKEMAHLYMKTRLQPHHVEEASMQASERACFVKLPLKHEQKHIILLCC